MSELHTSSNGFKPIYSAVLRADFPGAIALNGTAGTTGAVGPARAIDIGYQKGWNKIQVFFAGTNAADETFDFELYAYKANGPAVLVCSTTGDACALGTQQNGSVTALWCDTIAITQGGCFDAVVKDNAANRVAIVEFDIKGYTWLQCNLINTSAGVESVTPYVTGY